MQFNVAQREIALKIVFYGPPLSGKTTNLQAIHRLLGPHVAGRLTTLDTSDDRTLFFDLLPVSLSSDAGYTLKLKLYTVPGQVVHAATRKLVLAGADGVVFVADSQLSQARVNNEFWHGMQQYMRESAIDPATIPTVIQFNKRDMPDVRSSEELESLRARSAEPVYEAVAVRGEGVIETLLGLLGVLFKDLNRRYEFERKFNISGRRFMELLERAARGEVGEGGGIGP